jgi:hypothetical protein
LKRLIKIEYSGKYGDRVCRASSLEGALRAVTIRLAHGEYQKAQVLDERFGTLIARTAQLAFRVERDQIGIIVTWFNKPQWTKQGVSK